VTTQGILSEMLPRQKMKTETQRNLGTTPPQEVAFEKASLMIMSRSTVYKIIRGAKKLGTEMTALDLLQIRAIQVKQHFPIWRT